jgi:proteasome lid subunit RPN8/RPN11
MSNSLPSLIIPEFILDKIYNQAIREFPNECCGWLFGPTPNGPITGLRACTNTQANNPDALVQNRSAETAFSIDGRDLIELNMAFDTKTLPLVIYHSHPNGKAYFSDTDRRVASSPWGDGPMYPVQQLVIGIREKIVVEFALFGWSDKTNNFEEKFRHQVIS